MKLRVFLEEFIEKNKLSNKRIFIFQGASYQVLFFAKLIEQIKKHYCFEAIDVANQNFSLHLSRLETTFLGQSIVYCLKNSHELDDKKEKQLLTYLASYTGPHIIICFIKEKVTLSSADTVVINIEEEAVDKEYFLLIIRILYPLIDIKKVNFILKHISSRRLSLCLDDICLIAHYLTVCPTIDDDFLKLLDSILVPDTTLFTLSQYFFSKNVSLFYQQWNNQINELAESFLVNFWSDQLWRASCVIDLYEKKQFAQAKTVAFRLPFSFLQTDWKKYSSAELRIAHDFIYGMDYQLKNSGESFCFDLFYSKFFTGQFRC